jgi:hypothetical protein
MPGTSSIRARSIPAFKVIVELGQLPQAPKFNDSVFYINQFTVASVAQKEWTQFI